MRGNVCVSEDFNKRHSTSHEWVVTVHQQSGDVERTSWVRENMCVIAVSEKMGVIFYFYDRSRLVETSGEGTETP